MFPIPPNQKGYPQNQYPPQHQYPQQVPSNQSPQYGFATQPMMMQAPQTMSFQQIPQNDRASYIQRIESMQNHVFRQNIPGQVSPQVSNTSGFAQPSFQQFPTLHSPTNYNHPYSPSNVTMGGFVTSPQNNIYAAPGNFQNNFIPQYIPQQQGNMPISGTQQHFIFPQSPNNIYSHPMPLQSPQTQQGMNFGQSDPQNNLFQKGNTMTNQYQQHLSLAQSPNYQYQSATLPTNQNIQNGNFVNTNITVTAPQNVPFNLQRANFTHNVSYHPMPTNNNKDMVQQTSNDQNNQENLNVPTNNLLRVSTIKSNFQDNPYYYNLGHNPSLHQSIRARERQGIRNKKEGQQKQDTLKIKESVIISSHGSDFSEFFKFLGRLRENGKKFTDKEFPADQHSLIGNNKMRLGEWGQCIWLRADEFYGDGNYDVFLDAIEPADIKQGELGDCYFLSTLSSLAEWPERVRKIFGSKKANTCGCYCVKICEMGEWKDVIIDDCFPCDKFTRKPIFTRGNENELWVLILEKAWAKIYGSYDAIESGLARECLHDLTGAPTKFYLTDRSEEWEMIWHKISKAEKNQYAMTCGAGDFFTQNNVNLVNSKGIVSSHAYSLLSTHEVNTSEGRIRLVRLRNPWGKTEWNGEWSDSSDKWTPALKKQLGWQDRDDGIFFMAYEDFLQYFTDIQLCYIHDDYQYNSLRVNSDHKHAIYFKMRVDTPGKYYITINQESKRKHSDNPDFRYSPVSIVVAKILPNQQYEYVAGNYRTDREVWAKGKLTQGEYLIYAKVQWTSEQNTDFVLSSYGPSRTALEIVSKNHYPLFLEKAFITKARMSQKKLDYAREGESNCHSVVDISRDGFIYCYYQNLSARTLQTSIVFKQFEGIKLRKPYRGQSFKLNVAPNQEQIVLIRILPDQDVRQVISEKAKFF